MYNCIHYALSRFIAYKSKNLLNFDVINVYNSTVKFKF